MNENVKIYYNVFRTVNKELCVNKNIFSGQKLIQTAQNSNILPKSRDLI